jgi:tRNA pseudouridine(38-40) synthase
MGKWGKKGGGGGGGGDRPSWVQKDLSKPHPGSIPIEKIKESEEWQSRHEFPDKAPKRKYALCVGYLGTNYQGLQINPDAVTVESILEKALMLAGGVTEMNFGNLQKLGWSRAARTDRGVHAVSQCCAMRLTMGLQPEEREEFRTRVNRFLPADIRVLAITKVTKNFSAKLFCSKRRYLYLMPTYLLRQVSEVNALLEAAFAKQGPVLGAGHVGGYADPGSSSFLGPEALETVRQSLSAFRASPEELARLRAMLARYQGTSPYHNFTVGKTSADANANRFIISFTADDPFVDEATGVEWVLLSVVGQSFLLNQIRKMVGFVVDMVRGAAPETAFDSAFSSMRVDVPMAPGEGLFLDELFFDGYNKKMEGSNEMHQRAAQKKAAAKEGGGDGAVDVASSEAKTSREEGEGEGEAEGEGPEGENGAEELFVHEMLDWAGNEAATAAMAHFRDRVILPHIRHLEGPIRLPFLFYLDSLRVRSLTYAAKEFAGGGGAKSKRKRGDEEDEE